MKLILDFDPFTGISHWVDTDEETGITTYGVDQDVDDLIEGNMDAYNGDHGRWGDGQLVARVPMALYAKWVREGRDRDQPFLKRFFNDPENRKFRLRPGVI